MKPRPASFSPFATCARPLPRTAWQCRSSNPSFATWREMAMRSAATAISTSTSTIRAASISTTSNRPARSAPVPAKRPSKPSTTTTTVPAKRSPPPSTSLARGGPAALNPPLDTYAPPLEVPARQPGQAKVKWLYHAGKAYVRFYKGGIKNVWSTSKLAKTLRLKEAAASSSSASSDKRSDPTTTTTTVLTRAEWQLARRSRADMLRLPGFALVLLVLGEWTALVALYLTPVIPEPCRIPAQIERLQGKVETRRAERFKRVAHDAARLAARSAGAGEVDVDVKRFSAKQARALREALAVPEPRVGLFQLLLLSARFDAHPGVLDRLLVTPPRWLLVRRLREKMDYLVKDDGLVARDGGWSGLRREEVVRACFERGVDVKGRSEAELRKVLAAWGV